MAYVCDLGTGQQIYLQNQDDQTSITLTTSGPGQQQSQGSSIHTGRWTLPPTVFRLPTGVVLRIEATRGQFFVQVQAGVMQLMSAAPHLADAEVLSLRQVAGTTAASQSSMAPMPPMEPMKPMEPMEPMKMGDMEMRMKPMEMRMGNMHLQMGSPSQPAEKKRFCTQCGAPVGANDRFCGQCGHRLVPDAE